MKKFVLYIKSKSVRFGNISVVDEDENVRIGEIEVSKTNWRKTKKEMKKRTIYVKIVLSSPRYSNHERVNKTDIIGYGTSIEDIQDTYAEYFI